MSDTPPPIDQLPPGGLLRRPWEHAGVPLKRSEVYRRASAGTFPAPLKIGPRASAWRIGELQEWLKDPLSWRPGQAE
jgi:prophage regulatory protein